MPKAYKVLIKVHSAEIKYEKDQPPVVEPRCRLEYDAFAFETRQQPDSDQKQPSWQDEFEVTYFAKAPVVFRLLALDPVTKSHKELCRGELDLEKRKGQTGEAEVTLKTEAKKDKSAGLLRVTLTWLGDFELTPFRLEVVVHTAEVARRKELGQCKVRAQLGHHQVKASEKEVQETPLIQAAKSGQFVWKQRLQWLVTTQDELRLELLGQNKSSGQGPSIILRLNQLLQMKPGVVKKLWLLEPLPEKVPEKITDKKAELASEKKEEKREKRAALWILVNHNHKAVLDPKQSGLMVADRAERSMSPSQARVAGTSLSKQSLRKWVYEEFKPQQKKKISLAAMDDREKEAYLATQIAVLTKLRAHKEVLRDHLEQLEDKMDETLGKMREKKQTEEKTTPEEKQRKLEMDEKFKEIRRLQVEAEKLKEEFTGGSGFDKLKELENTKGMRTKKIVELKQEVERLEKNNEKREQRYLEIEEKNKEENKRLTDELHKARDHLKLMERETDKRAEVSKSVNAASLQLEKEYRELCRKHKINDVLMVRGGEQGDYQFRDFDPTRAKTPTRKATDKRMLNPIWRGIQDDKKLEAEKMTPEEKAIAEKEKEITSLTMSEANSKKLLQLWKEALASKESAKGEARREEREAGEKKKEIARLEAAINDRKNLIRVLSQKMRDLKKAQMAERQLAEKRRLQQTKAADEEWDSQFQSTRQSGFRDSQPQLEYDVDVEIALERLLGREQLAGVKREGYYAGSRALEESGDQGEQGEEEQEGEPEQEGTEEDQDLKDEQDQDEPEEDKPKEIDHKEPKEMKEGSVVLPLEKNPKPWEVPEKESRTEIVVGVRYNKDFEQLFDDRAILKERKPVRIVRVKAHFNHEFIVGVQFSYMTEKEELVDGVFHGDKKVIVNNLKKVQYEIQYREHIEHITACFSRGLHWLELKTNEGRSLLLGEKSGASAKAVTQEKSVLRQKGEDLTYVSGGFTGKDKRFTYLAFHLVSGWGKKEDFFKDMKDDHKDAVKDTGKDAGKPAGKEPVKDTQKDTPKPTEKDIGKDVSKDGIKDAGKLPGKDKPA